MPHPASHADHDALLVAAYAAGDAMGPELDAALALVATCPDCAALHHDLRAIAAATAVLPAPVRPRSRDFRLAPERAASLRPSGWRRVLGPLAGPRFAFAGPLGTGLVTLGLAGFLVAGAAGMPVTPSAGAPGGGLGSESAPVERMSGNGGEPSPVAGAASVDPGFKAQDMASPVALAPVGPAQMQAGPSQLPAAAPPAGQGTTMAGQAASAPPVAAEPPAANPAPVPTSTTETVPARPPLLPLISAAALLAGIVLVGFRFAGRRMGART
jgi:hypothetical protein